MIPNRDMLLRRAETLQPGEIRAWLLALRGRPYVPASGFDVGAVLRVSQAGQVFYTAGVNVENADPALAVHGEGAALAAMVTALGPGARVEEAWVMAAPRDLTADSDNPLVHSGGSCCGRCRQHLFEFAAHGAVKVHLVALHGEIVTHTVAAMLPAGFSFANYKEEAVRARKAAYDAAPPGSDAVFDRVLRAQAPGEDGIFNWLHDLRAVDFASGREQVVVLCLENGTAAGGVKMEDAAFTGLNAAQAAVAIATTSFGGEKVRIRHIYTMGRGAGVPDDGLVPLPLSALQVLREFSDMGTPVTMFTPDGDVLDTELGAAGGLAPTIAHGVFRLRDGQDDA